MHRFFVDPDAWSADGCVLKGEEAHHLVNVLRLRPGAKILLFDGRGGQWEGEVKSIGRGAVYVALTGERNYVPMPLAVNLLQGLPKVKARPHHPKGGGARGSPGGRRSL